MPSALKYCAEVPPGTLKLFEVNSPLIIILLLSNSPKIKGLVVSLLSITNLLLTELKLAFEPAALPMKIFLLPLLNPAPALYPTAVL